MADHKKIPRRVDSRPADNIRKFRLQILRAWQQRQARLHVIESQSCHGSFNITSCHRISELPWFIQHHILSFLEPKHAAETMSLSKKWLEIWSSFPFLRFNQSNFHIRLLSLHRNLDSDDSEDDSDDSEDNSDDSENDSDNSEDDSNYSGDSWENIYDGWFEQAITKTLSRFHANKQRIRMLRLTLETDLVPHLEAWVNLPNGLYIEDLMLQICLEGHNPSKPTLPPSVFVSRTITELHLEGCDLNPCMVSRDAIRLPSLRKLYASCVSLDDAAFITLTSSCPSIVILSLRRCIGLQNVKICNLNNLMEMEFCSTSYDDEEAGGLGLTKFIIEAPKLEKLRFANLLEKGGTCELKVSSEVCRKLRHAVVQGVSIREELLHSISSFSLLEYFGLERCKLPRSIRISSHSLREVSFYCCENLEAAQLDTPNLLSLEYNAGANMPLPCLVSDEPAGKWVICTNVHHVEDVNSAWISNLFNGLAASKHFQELTITIDFPTLLYKLNAEDLRRVQFPSPLKLEKISLELVFSSQHLIALWDGFLWRFRPRFLSLCPDFPCTTSAGGYRPPAELIKELANHLIFRDEDGHCCNLREDKCWRHFLKDVKKPKGIVEVEGMESGTCVDVETLADEFRKYQNSQFKTDWVFELIW